MTHKFNARYAADRRFSLEKKSSFKVGLQTEMEQASKKLKGFNAEAEARTAQNAAAKMEDPSNLTYNPDRLMEVTAQLLRHANLKRLMTGLVTKPTAAIRKRFSETDIRNLLMSMTVVTGGGARPHVIANCTIGEFLAGKPAKDGTIVVKVKDHKVARKYGPQAVAYAMDGLHAATRRYIDIFRTPIRRDELLFRTKEGRAPLVKHAVDWLKKAYIKDLCTAEELASLTPKSWRKGWSNWAEGHPDPEVRRIATRVMCHSPGVQKSNYSVVNAENAAKFGAAVLGTLAGHGEDSVKN